MSDSGNLGILRPHFSFCGKTPCIFGNGGIPWLSMFDDWMFGWIFDNF